MTILVTGASGRVGPNLVKALVERGEQVVSMVYPGDPQAGKLDGIGTEVRQADLTDTPAVLAAAGGAEVIIHVGALMGEPTMGAETFLDVNVMGTQRLLDAALQNNVQRFIYYSSTAAYDTDRVAVHPTPEDVPLDPLALYGASKRMAEALVENYGRVHGLPYVIFRPSDIRAGEEILNGWTVRSTLGIYTRGVKDPRRHFYVADDPQPWSELEALAEEKGSALCAATDLDGQPWERHSTDVRDMVGATLAALDSDAALGGIFNVAAPEPMPMPAVAKHIAEKTGEEMVTVATPTRRRVNLSVQRMADIFYQPKYGYQRMIDDAFALRAGEDIGVIPT